MRFGSRQGCAIAILTVLLGPSQSRMNVDELSLTLVSTYMYSFMCQMRKIPTLINSDLCLIQLSNLVNTDYRYRLEADVHL